MKKLIALAVVALSLTACGQIEGTVNSFKSATGMLERKVTLYNANGTEIKSWVTDNTIEYQGSVAAFIAKDGTNVRISGTFIVEGK